MNGKNYLPRDSVIFAKPLDWSIDKTGHADTVLLQQRLKHIPAGPAEPAYYPNVVGHGVVMT